MNFLLIPGINNTAATFDGVVAALAPPHLALAPDCPPLETVEALAAALLRQAPSEFVAAGHSFGGYVALAMLATAPDRVQGIVLINSNDWADPPALAAGRREKALQAENGGYEALADAASSRAYHAANAGRADLMAERAAALRGYGAARFAAHQRACAGRPDRSALLAGCGKPLLVVSGDCDVVVPTERQQAMATRLAADHVIVPQAGHMLPAEQPALLAGALVRWAEARFPALSGG